jgi:hypothetical protein
MVTNEGVPEARTSALRAIARTGNATQVVHALMQLIGAETAALAIAVNTFGNFNPKGPDSSTENSTMHHLDHFVPYVGRRLKRRAELEGQLSVLDSGNVSTPLRDRARDLLRALCHTPRAAEVRSYFTARWKSTVKRSLEKFKEADRLAREALAACEEASPGELEKSLAELSETLVERDKHKAALAILSYETRQFPALAAAAVEALGGLEHLESCVRNAWQSGSGWFGPGSASGEIKAVREPPVALDDRVPQYEASSLPTDFLTSVLTPVRARPETASNGAATSLTARAHRLVALVRQADEAAMQELTTLAAACPAAFPQGISKAFTCIQPTEAQLAGYIVLRLAEL